MIEISFRGSPSSLMEYLDLLVQEEDRKDKNWTDRLDYNSEGEPNE